MLSTTVVAEYMVQVETVIPASSGTALTLPQLLCASGTVTGGVATNNALTLEQLRRVVGWEITGQESDGTNRAAIDWSSDADCGEKQVVASATAWQPAFWTRIDQTHPIYVQANADTAITIATIVAYIGLR